MIRDFSVQAAFMGTLAAFTGFASSFAVVQQGLLAVGATDAQVAVGLAALSVAMGLCAIGLSMQSRMPVSIAWSTPGAALLVSTGALAGGFPAAVGAFVVCAAMLIVAGLWRPLGQAVARIPSSLANGMLAGVLINLCFAPFKAIASTPALALPIFLTWVIVGAFSRLLAVPAALVAFAAVVVFGIDTPTGAFTAALSEAGTRFTVVVPVFNLAGILNVAIPLFIVTMASQNIPGIAVMRSNGYAPSPRLWFSVTGLFSMFSAPFGGHAINLAAITAALCAGDDVHANRDRRYWAAIVAGILYVVFGLLTPMIIALVSVAPTLLIQAVAGLALIGAFSGAAVAALNEPDTREAAAVTFLFSASGISVFGISGAFWGLVAGGLILLLKRKTGQP